MFDQLDKWWEQVEFQQPIILQSELVDIIAIKPKFFNFTKSFLHQRYVVEGLSSKEIAAQTFSSRATVTKHLNNYGIPLKTVTRRETGGHVYGYRKFQGGVIPVQKEQAVIGIINNYRTMGYSYQRIADFLNTQSRDKKARQGVWYSKVIRQIFLRSTGSNQNT